MGKGRKKEPLRTEGQLYTEEQLSAILSAHAAGVLRPCGMHDFGMSADPGLWRGTGCVNQFAFNDPMIRDSAFSHGGRAHRAACWFDHNYWPTMSPEKLLEELEEF